MIPGLKKAGCLVSPGAVDSSKASVIVGVSLCGHDGRRGHIYHLAVDPRYQGTGLGKRLVEECFSGLRDAGIQRAIILVADDNVRGREFWRRCDWEELSGALAMGKDVGGFAANDEF